MTEEGRRQSFSRKVGGFGLGTAISRILGLVREMTFSYLFGAGMMMDAFRIAFNIPNLLRDLFSEGSLGAAFLPIFSDYDKKWGKKKAFQFTGYVFNILLLFIGLLVAIGILFSPQIVRVIAHGFTNDPQKLALTIRLTRIIFPFVIFMVFSALTMAVLNYFNHFFTTGVAPALFNVGIIVCSFIFTPILVERGISPVISVGIGVLVGAFLQLLIQLPYFIKSGFRFVRKIDFREKGLLRLLKILLPIEFSYAVTRINVMVNMFLASLLVEGSVSYLGYAMRLMQLPIGVLGMAVANVTLPDASRLVSESRHEEVIKSFSRSIRFVFFLTVPTSVFLFVLRVPVVGFIFERGAFTAQDTIFTSQALAFYCLGIFAMSSSRVVTSIFYAYKDARTPLFLSIFAVILNIILSVILMRFLYFRGLALAVSIASIVNLCLLLSFLKKKIGSIDGKRIMVDFLKTVLAAAVSGGIIFYLLSYLENVLNYARTINYLIESFTLFIFGALIFFALSRLLNIESAKQIKTHLRHRQ
jgi:putative peptidoglycan lipid II flippase